MPPLTTILFDLDGTIIDSVRLILDSYHHTLKIHGHPAQTDEAWLAGIGTPLWHQLAPYSRSPDDMAAMIATYRDYNLAHHDTRVTPYSGVVEMIRGLKAASRRRGLVTSKNRNGAMRGLTLAGIADLFETMVCADEVSNHKPHPEPVLMALDRLAASAASTVFVGDSIHDMQSGRAAGVRTAAVLWGPFTRADLAPAEPDYWLETPGDLARLAGLGSPS